MVKRVFPIVCCLLSACFLAAYPALAHHGVAGYDMEKVITLSGTVTNFNWANPHCLVHIAVKDASGQSQDWIVELAAPTLMTRYGWNKDSLKPGDNLIAQTHPARNGATTGLSADSLRLMKFIVNGRELPNRRD